MNRTKIEWVKNPDGSQGYTWNPITGCLNHVNGLCNGGGFPCYAYKLAYGRLKEKYLENRNLAPNAKGGVMKLSIAGRATTEREGDWADPFYPRFWEEKVDEIWNLCRGRYAKAKGIFLCDMSDLFGIGIPEDWTRTILDAVSHAKPHRFYLLTKQPQNLIKFSPFPENCWVGVTATNRTYLKQALLALAQISAKVKYISFEPLLGPVFCNHDWHTKMPPPRTRGNISSTCSICGDTNNGFNAVGEDFNRGHTRPIVNWPIIGGWTGSIEDKYRFRDKSPDLQVMEYGHKITVQPKIEWVREIVEAADKAGIPVFLKDNLRPLLTKVRDGAEYAPLWANGGYGTLRQELPK